MTVAYMMPEKVREACQTLKQRVISKGCAGIQGLHQSLLIESMDEPGRVTWISCWDSLAEARSFLGSSGYAGLVAILQPYLLSDLQGYGYSVLADLKENQENLFMS